MVAMSYTTIQVRNPSLSAISGQESRSQEENARVLSESADKFKHHSFYGVAMSFGIRKIPSVRRYRDRFRSSWSLNTHFYKPQSNPVALRALLKHDYRHCR